MFGHKEKTKKQINCDLIDKDDQEHQEWPEFENKNAESNIKINKYKQGPEVANKKV